MSAKLSDETVCMEFMKRIAQFKDGSPCSQDINVFNTTMLAHQHLHGMPSGQKGCGDDGSPQGGQSDVDQIGIENKISLQLHKCLVSIGSTNVTTHLALMEEHEQRMKTFCNNADPFFFF